MWLPSQQGREGPLGCTVVGHYSYICCVLFAFVAAHPCSRPSLCVSSHARPCFAHMYSLYVSRVSRYRYAQARTFARPSGRWQRRMKGCRTAARVKFCVGLRTCAHGSTAPKCISRVAHATNDVCHQFLGHTLIYEEGALISTVLCKHFAGNFEQELSHKICSGNTFQFFSGDGKQSLPEISGKNFPIKFVVRILLNFLVVMENKGSFQIYEMGWL